jgi:hypothetical protein
MQLHRVRIEKLSSGVAELRLSAGHGFARIMEAA